MDIDLYHFLIPRIEARSGLDSSGKPQPRIIFWHADDVTKCSLWLDQRMADWLRAALDQLYPAPACNNQCYPKSENFCPAKDLGFLCSLSKGHTGDHVACGSVKHDLHIWPATDLISRDQDEWAAAQRYAEGHAAEVNS